MTENATSSIAVDPVPPPISTAVSNRITVREIAKRLAIGRQAVYRMLAEHIIPGVRVGARWIVTRYAYEQWERSAGMAPNSTEKIQ